MKARAMQARPCMPADGPDPTTAAPGPSILDTLAAGVVVVGADGRLTYVNPGAGRILRCPAEDLLGAAVDEVLVPMSALLHAPSQREERGEGEVRRVDGTRTVVGFSVSPPTAKGERTVLFQEITGLLELRRDRDRLLQMAALGDALPSVLHELRNPLASITSALEVLIEERDEALREDLHAILWEVRRMGLTLQGVGGLVRTMHSKRHVAIDLAVSEACRILQASATRRGIVLTIQVPTLPLLPLDWGGVSGVVFNLVKNAMDACEEGGRITVRASLESDDAFVLQVADTGSGMTPEVLAHCRELFFTSKEKGSGIGLALCQQIAALSGGRLDIDTEVGQGTTITLRVPLHPQDT